ncbi:biopolymer transporter ExbD [Ectothiorhodospiraceae bacterium 2226]|nr:biopolymer transporter ExbD [Ectothiorhodospiraceae bacterium 2226]
MRRKHHYRRKKEAPELDVTTFLNLMVVLIPFLLVTAVFSRITIQELNMPEAAGGSQVDKPLVTIEVIVRERALEVGDGKSVVLSIPKRDDGYDLPKLSEFLIKLKERYEEKEDATVLLEPDIAYEDMIHVMDAVKVAEVRIEGEEEVRTLVLFPEISIGDAP